MTDHLIIVRILLLLLLLLLLVLLRYPWSVGARIGILWVGRFKCTSSGIVPASGEMLKEVVERCKSSSISLLGTERTCER